VPYALWPDPRLLLALQAGLFTLGALPVYWLAHRQGSSRLTGCCLAAIYLFYPTAVTAVLFDLHGDTLAMPLLLFTLDALDRRAWRSYVLFVALSLSCKFYVAVPIALLGPLIWWCYGERRAAVLTTAVGLSYAVLAFFVIRPLFTTSATLETHRGLNYLTSYFGELQQVLASLRNRAWHGSIVFGPALPLVWLGWRWLLPAVPIAALALLSTSGGPAYAFYFHHYAVVVPFIMMSAIKGTARLPAGAGSSLLVALMLLSVILFNRAYVNTPLSRQFWAGWQAGRPDDVIYGVTPRDRLKDRFIAEEVVPEVPLAASNILAAHVANRETLYLTRHPDPEKADAFPSVLSQVDQVLTDALMDNRDLGDSAHEIAQISQVMHDPQFGLVAARDGILLFQRDPSPEQILIQRVEVKNLGPELDQRQRPVGGRRALSVLNLPELRPLQATFGPRIGLIDSSMTSLGDRRFRIVFEWLLTGQAPPANSQYAAVSRLEGADGSRMVHLPTYALAPPRTWQRRHTVRETFDVELPPDLKAGTYTWRVGWYDLRKPFSYLTDERTLLPGSQEVAVGTIVVR
jgi:uncharacterized membrane protein